MVCFRRLLDLFLESVERVLQDVDVVIPRRFQLDLQKYLTERGWKLLTPFEKRLNPWPAHMRLEMPRHQGLAFRGERFIDLLLTDLEDVWRYRRDPSILRSKEKMSLVRKSGIPYLARDDCILGRVQLRLELRASALGCDHLEVESGEELHYAREHVPMAVLKSLRRGRYAIEDELDLHGLTAVEARDALRAFLASAAARRLACVRVVHGKGRGSGPRGPVLKKSVNLWLRKHDEVLAFASARQAQGGTGAVYVLLRGSA